MSINIWTDSMQHAALLGKPVLFTNWLIQRDIIPDGWYCYDLRGTHKSPSTRTTLVDHAADYHAGTVLSPIPLKHEGTASRRVNGTFYLLGEEMTLEQFCEEHDLAYPQDNREFVLRPASLDEVGLFYSEEKLDEALGTVGHLRMDFGHGEKEFWHTWWPHNEDRFNTPEFKEVLQRFVDDLRQTGLLKNLGAMDAYCWQHGGSITEDRRSYGYIAETENYRFCLRCTPFPGEYQGYLYCYDLCQQEMYRQEHPVVGRVTFASGEQQEFTDSKALLQAIREELPFRSTTGFRFETLTDDPEVKKAVDDILLDFAGEDNSRRTCNYGLTETGKQALRKAADPSIPHTYAWFVMADTNTPQEIIRQDLTLEEAIQIYQDSNTSEKRLGVIKDGMALLDTTEEGSGFQERLLELLGEQHQEDHGGVFTDFGYAELGGEIKDIYVCQSNETACFHRSDAPVVLEVRKGFFNDPSYDNDKTAVLNLPAADAGIWRAVEKVDAASVDECAFRCVDCLIPFLRDAINNAIDDEDGIEQADEFAKRLAQIEREWPESDMVKYKALLSVVDHPSLQDATRLMGEIDQYELRPEVAQTWGYAEMMFREKYSALPEELFQTPQAAQIGQKMLDDRLGVITEYGLIRRKDGQPFPVFQPEQEIGQGLEMM